MASSLASPIAFAHSAVPFVMSESDSDKDL
jgi:hypothetical protein